MATVPDQHPIKALAARGAYPAFGVSVRPCAHGGILTTVMSSAARTASKSAVNFKSRSRMRNRHRPALSPEAHQQVADLLGHPLPARVRDDPAQVHPSAVHVNKEQ